MEGKTRKTDGRTIKERWKTRAIIVLVIFAVYFSLLLIQSQIWKTNSLSFFIWDNFSAIMNDTEQNSAAERAGTQVFDLFQPQYFAVTRSDGSRDVFRGHSELYRELKPLLRTLTDSLYKGKAAPVTIETDKQRENGTSHCKPIPYMQNYRHVWTRRYIRKCWGWKTVTSVRSYQDIRKCPYLWRAVR